MGVVEDRHQKYLGSKPTSNDWFDVRAAGAGRRKAKLSGGFQGGGGIRHSRPGEDFGESRVLWTIATGANMETPPLAFLLSHLHPLTFSFLAMGLRTSGHIFPQ